MKCLMVILMLLSPPLLFAQEEPGNNGMGQVGQILKSVFKRSSYFTDNSSYWWVDGQLMPTVGERTDFSKIVVPALGLSFEKHLSKNLGLRISASTYWWEEDKILVSTPSEDYNLTLRYQYHTIGIGGTYHFGVPLKKIDPYIGYLFSYRYARAQCECFDETNTLFSGDFLIGTRYIFSKGMYLVGEYGRNGTGFFKLGLGVKFNNNRREKLNNEKI